PMFPDTDLHRRQTHRLRLELANASEIRGALELSLERIRPAVVRASELARFSGGFAQHGCCMMPADIEKTTQDVVFTADDHEGLAGNFGGDVLSGLFDLLLTTRDLPRIREDRPTLEFSHLGTEVPR